MAQPPHSNPWRLTAIAMELAAGPLGGALIGYWIDSWADSAPWGLLIGALVGLTTGLYLFVKEIVRIMRENERR